MSIFRKIIFLFGTLNLVFFPKTAAIDKPIYIFCTDAKGDLSYQTHIQQVLATIYSQARTYNYGAWSTGGVNGAAQCRGDVSTEDCLNCILQVNNILHGLCTASFEALVYYDACQLYYTYNTRWPGYDQDIYFCLEGDTVFGDKDWFRDFMTWLFNLMADRALDSPSYMGYGTVELGPSNVYAYAQCYNFLEPEECSQCIQNTGYSLQFTCATPYIGGRAVAGSCTVRYESYPFLGQGL